jgi:hypothetical protein
MEENRLPNSVLNMKMKHKCPKKDHGNNEVINEDIMPTNKQEINGVKRCVKVFMQR